MTVKELKATLDNCKDSDTAFADISNYSPIAPFAEIVKLGEAGVTNGILLELEYMEFDEDINPLCEECGQPT